MRVPYVPLGRIARIRRGASPRPIRDPKWFADSGRGWVRISDVTASNGVLTKTEQYLSSDGVSKSVPVDPGDLILSICATIGVPVVIGIPACIHDGFVVMRDYEKSLDRQFLYYYLLSMRDRLAHGGQPGTQRNLNTSIVSKIDIPLLPLPEQRKIAEILGTWDEAITLVERRLAAARARKQGLMQRLLTGQVRFPGFTEPWREVRLGEVATINAEQLGESTPPDARFRYIELSAVSEGEISLPDEPEPFSALPSRARRILHRNDVIMATVRPYLRGFALCDFDSDHLICSTGFALLSPDDLRDAEFVYQSLYSDALLAQMHGRVTGSNYPALNGSDVAALELAWPADNNERWCISAVLEACDDEVGLLTRKLAALQAQKKGLMQRLLTGEVRVGRMQ